MIQSDIPPALRVRLGYISEYQEEREANLHNIKALRREIRARQRWQMVSALSLGVAIALYLN
jgi:hypothetical protein